MIKKSIAVLITCYNRVNTTLNCLKHLFNAKVPEGYFIDVYLVDDNSPDDTGKIVKMNYPSVNVIEGTGNLYWNGGMRLAWKTAVEKKDYDFYLWLNDDTFIDKLALNTMILSYKELNERNIEALILGTCYDPSTKEITYSGSFNGIKVRPNGIPQMCTSIVGNFIFVSKTIFQSVGILNKKYTHGIGDTDYGIRVNKKGFNCFVASEYIGSCRLNNKIQWYDSNLKFIERLNLLFSPTGGAYIEWLKFKYEHYGLVSVVLSIIKTTLTLLFPKIKSLIYTL